MINGYSRIAIMKHLFRISHSRRPDPDPDPGPDPDPDPVLHIE